MATFTQTSSIGLATFTFTFDDGTMKLTRITALNNAPSPVKLKLGGNYILDQAIEANGGTYDLNIPTAVRPTWEMATVTNSDSVGTKQVVTLIGVNVWFGVE